MRHGGEKKNNIPYLFAKGSATSVNTDIYMFGGSSNGTYTKAYKYNTITDTYTQLANIPYNHSSGGSAVSIGTDIFIFGGNYDTSCTQKAYKYNTITNTYTQLANIPYQFNDGSIVTKDDNIYLFGSTLSTNTAYKYNTITNTYTQLANIPFAFKKNVAVVVGNSIYLFGADQNNAKQTYKYNIQTNNYTKVTTVPYFCSGASGMNVGYDIFLFGSWSGESTNTAYKYNTITDTYTQLANIPYQFNSGSAVKINDIIYLIGGETSQTTIQLFYPVNKSYNVDNTVVIAQGRTYDVGYNTELITSDQFEEGYQPLFGFADAWFYTLAEGLDGSMPVYYGDGTQWINIKNPPV